MRRVKGVDVNRVATLGAYREVLTNKRLDIDLKEAQILLDVTVDVSALRQAQRPTLVIEPVEITSTFYSIAGH